MTNGIFFKMNLLDTKLMESAREFVLCFSSQNHSSDHLQEQMCKNRRGNLGRKSNGEKKRENNHPNHKFAIIKRV